jgi:hypothetical protein
MKKRVSKMDSILPGHGTCAKNERGFFYSGLYREKTLSVFKISFSFDQNRLRKNTGQNAVKAVFV